MKSKKREKTKYKILFSGVLFILLIPLLTSNALSTYFIRQNIPNSTTSTGLLTFVVSPTESSTDITTPVSYQITNTGTLPLQITSSSSIYNCSGVSINGIYQSNLKPFTSFIPYQILQSGQSSTFNYVFSNN